VLSKARVFWGPMEERAGKNADKRCSLARGRRERDMGILVTGNNNYDGEMSGEEEAREPDILKGKPAQGGTNAGKRPLEHGSTSA